QPAAKAVAGTARDTRERFGDSSLSSAARGARKLDPERAASPECGEDSKADRQEDGVTQKEQDAVGDGSSQRPERSVLSPEQVVGQIEATEQVQRGARQRDDGNGMVIDSHHVRAGAASAS